MAESLVGTEWVRVHGKKTLRLHVVALGSTPAWLKVESIGSKTPPHEVTEKLLRERWTRAR